MIYKCLVTRPSPTKCFAQSSYNPTSFFFLFFPPKIMITSSATHEVAELMVQTDHTRLVMKALLRTRNT